MKPIRFIGESVLVQFDEAPTVAKKPGCPDSFIWQDETHRVVETLSEWHDYVRRGRMAHNMRPAHAAATRRRGSWGVGRDYYRVRTEVGRVFDLYYDRAPKRAGDGSGEWFLFREMGNSET